MTGVPLSNVRVVEGYVTRPSEQPLAGVSVGYDDGTLAEVSLLGSWWGELVRWETPEEGVSSC